MVTIVKIRRYNLICEIFSFNINFEKLALPIYIYSYLTVRKEELDNTGILTAIITTLSSLLGVTYT
jgi:hypothetical protein